MYTCNLYFIINDIYHHRDEYIDCSKNKTYKLDLTYKTWFLDWRSSHFIHHCHVSLTLYIFCNIRRKYRLPFIWNRNPKFNSQSTPIYLIWKCDLIVKLIVISPGDAFDKIKNWVNDTRGISAHVVTRPIVNKRTPYRAREGQLMQRILWFKSMIYVYPCNWRPVCIYYHSWQRLSVTVSHIIPSVSNLTPAGILLSLVMIPAIRLMFFSINTCIRPSLIWLNFKITRKRLGRETTPMAFHCSIWEL